MKIGIDARLWNETGVGRYIRNLVQQLILIDHNNQYVLFVLAKDLPLFSKFKIDKKWQIKVADFRWHTLKEQTEFAQVIYREKLDLMHFPYFSYPFLYRKRFVVTIHDLILDHYSTGQATTLPFFLYRAKLLGYKFILQSGIKHSTKIITVSNETKKEILEHFHIASEKIAVIYEGIDQNIVHKIKANDKLSSEKGYFLYVGNAYPHKNLERLLEAFNIFREECENQKSNLISPNLILVGNNDFFYKRLKEKVKKMNIEKQVVFKHAITDGELSYLYQNARALVLPSLMEGFGLPAVEAMANKCLVVASDIPSLHEICADAAIYFNQLDTLDIADKLMEIYINSKQFEKKTLLGLEKIREYSWQKLAEETLKIYESSFGI